MIARVACLSLLAVCLAPSARADDVDPEPAGASLRRLQGTWKSRAVLVQGAERGSDVTYTFAKDKVTMTPGGGKFPPRELTLAPDKTRKDLIELTPKGKGRSVRYFFEFRKGELYMAPVRPSDADPKPDFSGDTAPVLIFQREKK